MRWALWWGEWPVGWLFSLAFLWSYYDGSQDQTEVVPVTPKRTRKVVRRALFPIVAQHQMDSSLHTDVGTTPARGPRGKLLLSYTVWWCKLIETIQPGHCVALVSTFTVDVTINMLMFWESTGWCSGTREPCQEVPCVLGPWPHIYLQDTQETAPRR